MKSLDLSSSSQCSILPSQSTQTSISPSSKQTYHFPDGNHAKFLFSKLDSIGKILTLLTLLNLLLNIFYIYLDVEQPDDNTQSTLILNLMLWLNSLILLLIFLLALASQELQAANSKQPSLQPLLSLPLKFLSLQLLFTLLQPYSFLNDSTITTYNIRHSFSFQFKINYLLTIANTINKFLIIFKFIINRSIYYSCSAERICKIYEADFSYVFVVKSWFKSDPIKLGATILIWTTVVFSFCLHVCEGPLLFEMGKYGLSYRNGFDQYSNSLWYTIVTLTTAGYGDINVQTIFGRILAGALIFLSSFVVSLMVVVLTNELFTNLSEKRTITVINRLELKQKETLWAVNTLANNWRKKKAGTELKVYRTRNSWKKVGEVAQEEKDKKVEQYERRIEEYEDKIFRCKEVRRDLNARRKEMTSVEDQYEECSREFEDLIDGINRLMGEQKGCEEKVFGYLKRRGKGV